MNGVTVAGVGIHPFGRFDDKTVTDLGVEAVRTALAEAGVTGPGLQAAFCGTAYGGVAPETDTQKTLLKTSFANLDKISQARPVRLLTAHEDAGPPPSLWAVIFLTSAMVLGSVIVYGVENPLLAYSMVAIVAVIVARIIRLR